MNKITPLVTLVFAALFGCQKVIDVDLNSKDPQLIIEGNVTNIAQPYEVKITQTANFSDANTFPNVTDATVAIADNLGNVETLIQTKPGVYTTTTLIGVPGRTYKLTAIVNNKTYTASSTMPMFIKMDSLMLFKNPFNNELTVNSVAAPVFKDTDGLGNYYRFVEFKNGKKTLGNYLFNDNLSDGLLITNPLFSQNNKRVLGDTLRVEMHCVDKATYQYFNTIPRTEGGAPANPESNIIGGCLGYFSAHTVDVKQRLIN
jgi:hypothetical protein